MDIRTFFGGKAKEVDKSSHDKSKKRQPKIASPALDESQQNSDLVETLDSDSDLHFSDGENPIPRAVRKEIMKHNAPKRTRVLLEDSSDDGRSPKKAAKKAPPKTSPVKAATKPTTSKTVPKRSRTISSNSDESDGFIAKSPPKKRSSKKAASKPIHFGGGSDEEMDVDDMEEFIDKPTSKQKKMEAGQKKLGFAASKADNSKRDQAKSAPKTASVQKVSVNDFFGDSGAKKAKAPVEVAAKRKSNEKTNERRPSTEDRHSKKTATEISPSQKENAIDKQKVEKKMPRVALIENEFVEDEDLPPKKSPRKEKTSAKTKSSNADVSSMQTKKSPSKVAAPAKASDKKVTTTSATSLPTRIVGSNVAHIPNVEVDPRFMPWVDRHRPKSLAQLVGQHGDKSPMNKLLTWLKEWAKHNLGEGAKVKKPKPPPWMTQTDGSPFKAALLSGSPGVGKTSCAHLCCESLNFNFIEMNASDVRNKKHLEAQVSQLIGTHQLEEYFGAKANTSKGGDNEVRHVLIMDEVDGMSGNEDRAGLAELIQIIKDTKIPIICICNDRSNPKMRTLVNYCYDLRFQKPRVEQIRARMMTICCQEKLKVSKDELDEIIESSGHDVRQTIYNLQMRSALNSEGSEIQKKDVSMSTFDAARKLLDTRSSLIDKQDMFFVDYGIMPLFVQENYVHMRNDKHSQLEAIAGLRKAADLISMGDTVDRVIRTSGAWKLLNEQCMLGCALPSIAVDGHLRSQIQFPSWLGKNSTAGKRQRLMRQLLTHAQLKISADTHSLVTDYAPILRERLTKPLLEHESEGVPAVVATMTEYDLLRDDAEALGELAVWPGDIDPASKIQSKVKAALTRALNKEHRLLPYALDDVSKGRKKNSAIDTELEVDEEGNIVEKRDDENGEGSDEEEEETVVKNTKAKPASSRGGAAAGRGRGGARGGRGRGGK